VLRHFGRRRGLIVAASLLIAGAAFAGDGLPYGASMVQLVPRHVLVLAGHKHVTALAYSPDGRMLAIASSQGLVLWDAATGARVRALAGPEPSNGFTWVSGTVAFAPDGRVVAAGDRTGRIRLWNVADGTLAGELSPRGDLRELSSLVYAPDGRTLAFAGSPGGVGLWDTTGDRVRMLAGAAAPGSPGATLAFSADGRHIVQVRYDLTAMTWDVTTGEPVRDPQVRAGPVDTGGLRINQVAFDPHGPTIAVAGFKMVLLVDPATGESRELVGHVFEVASVAFAPDGRTLVSVGGFYDNTARLWDVRTGTQLRLLGMGGHFNAVVYSPDGHSVAGVLPYADLVVVSRV
jgi:WD40 repeat protein